MFMAEKSPRAFGYYLPAEWEKHDATWLSWPKNPLTFPSDIIENVEEIYCKMIRALSYGEKVKILVDDAKTEQHVLRKLENHGARMKNVIIFMIKSADVWIRDYGPTFLLSKITGEKAVVKWTFNAWGEKYDDLLYDNTTGEDIVKQLGLPVFRPDIVLEGGSIDVNGLGTVLTTEQCLLNKNRNPQLTRDRIELCLEEYIGAPNVVWLKSGIEGDDTDGHIDDFARFVGPNHVLCAYSESSTLSNQKVLQTNLEILQASVNQEGQSLEVTKLPMPRPQEIPDEERVLPTSYANFYIGNKVVLLPVFDDPMDAVALDILKQCFPDREIEAVQATDLVYGYGGFHCVTQQEPRAIR